MNLNLIHKIEQQQPQFSKGQRLIAQYIIQHYDKAAYMTAAALGSTVGVSESTVVRFATELGFDGYPRLQKAVQEIVRAKLTSLQRMEVSDSRFGEDVLESVLSQDIDKIKYTLGEISKEDFRQTVDAIVAARRIYIIGARSSEALAVFLSYYFNLIFDNAVQVKSMGEAAVFEQMLRVGPKDVVIGISFPRYSRQVVSAVDFASGRSAQVVAVTDSKDSPVAVHASHLLLSRSDMASFADSLVAPLSLMNALVVSVAQRKKAELNHVLSELEDIWAKYQVYEQPGSQSQ